jgi:hypothetical protein
MDYVALAAELTGGHPVSGAYNADAQLAADQINALDVASIKSTLSGSEMWSNTVASEYGALTDAQKSQWLSFCAIESHDPEVGGLAQLFVVDIFGGGSVTVSNLSSARSETISRAAGLGLGKVKAADVLIARGEY